MIINIQKTVAMVFTPSRRSMIVSHTFPPLKIGDHCIRYVEQFKYLGHIVSDSLTDDEDINREIKNMFVRTNILLRKYNRPLPLTWPMAYTTACTTVQAVINIQKTVAMVFTPSRRSMIVSHTFPPL